MIKKYRKFIILAGIVILLGLAVFLLFGRSEDEDAGNLYRTQRVNTGQLRVAVGATGTLKPVLVVNVGTQVSGTVKEIFVDYNEHVKAGQLLLVLDEEPFKARVKQAQANLGSAKARMKVAQVKVDRYDRLYSLRTATKEEWEQAVADRDVAQAEVDQQEAQLEIEEYNLRNARITSPVDGVVIDKVVDIGQTVAASFQTPTLIQIAQDLTKMQIDASFAEADIGRLTPGLKADFTVDTFPGRTFTGVVRQVRLNPTTEQSVVTYNVVIDVDNPDLQLLPGMTAYVDIELHKEASALLVPNTALNFRPTLPADEASAKAEAAAKPEAVTNDGMAGAGRPASPPAGAAAPASEEDSPAKPREGRVYMLAAGRLKEVPLLLGATDQRQTVVLGGELKDGDVVVIGDKNAAQTNQRQRRGPF